MSARILVVEDEAEIASYLRRGLSYEGYTVEIAPDGRAALAAARERPPDLIILDVMLPGMDGMEVARRLRTGPDIPIIMLTARDSVADRIAGLESGADDYLTKPFAFEELLARIRVKLRHQMAQRKREELSLGWLHMDVAAHKVYCNTCPIELTAREFEILELFLRHPNQVLTREVLYDRIWGYNYGNDSNVIEVYISALRQKLELEGYPRMLHTVRGVGYILRD